MRPQRLAEIKLRHAECYNQTRAHDDRGELIAEVERLQGRETELLAANGNEVERRRDAQRRLLVLAETVDGLVKHILDDMADLRDALGLARKNAFATPAVMPQRPHRAEAGDVLSDASPAPTSVREDETTATEIGRV